MRLRILLAVIGTLSRCSAWMAASIVSISHLFVHHLVPPLIASHSGRLGPCNNTPGNSITPLSSRVLEVHQ